MESNENCSLCRVCQADHKALGAKLIGIADARLYNTRFELGRKVDYDLYRLLRAYRPILKDICKGENCNFCYGTSIEGVLERIKILTVL